MCIDHLFQIWTFFSAINSEIVSLDAPAAVAAPTPVFGAFYPAQAPVETYLYQPSPAFAAVQSFAERKFDEMEIRRFLWHILSTSGLNPFSSRL